MRVFQILILQTPDNARVCLAQQEDERGGAEDGADEDLPEADALEHPFAQKSKQAQEEGDLRDQNQRKADDERAFALGADEERGADKTQQNECGQVDQRVDENRQEAELDFLR